jgi:hypothetical protein
MSEEIGMTSLIEVDGEENIFNLSRFGVKVSCECGGNEFHRAINLVENEICAVCIDCGNILGAN